MDNESSYSHKIYQFYTDRKRMPSYAELTHIFGFNSKNATYKLVQKLIDGGVVGKDRNGKLIPTEMEGTVPLLGSVTAGFPATVDEARTETIRLEDLLVRNRGNTFFLEVDGDSMIDAHIEDGDMVLVEKVESAKDGDIVIARIDGEWTMKYFKKKGDKAWLEPANKKYKPLYPTHELEVAAIVKAVIRTY